MRFVRDSLLIVLLISVISYLIVVGYQFNSSSDNFNCKNSGYVMLRCENKEVICYRYFTSIQCKFKEPNVRVIRYLRDEEDKNE